MKKILENQKEIKQEVLILRKLHDQFNPVVTDESLTLLQVETAGKNYFVFDDFKCIDRVSQSIKRSKYMDSPDYRGERFIKQNPLGQKSAKRLSLKGEAREVVRLVLKEMPEVNKWSDLEPADKLYYTMVLEDRAAAIGIDIFRCKKQWCARNILQEVMKARNQTNKRRGKERSTEEDEHPGAFGGLFSSAEDEDSCKIWVFVE
ncbi:hypothetical protein BC941DRAFT_458134 [Chlamydoabsidia padenii]|nr:hypothetical protein BC941DRAFT_458134 [Chlamydoabsidia padenii]